MPEEKSNIRRFLEQERGQFAWNCIQEIKKLPPSEQAEYRTRALTFNQMVHINGLGATLGFLKAKATKEQKTLNAYGYLLQHLTAWMHQCCFLEGLGQEFDALLLWVLEEADREAYRRATAECLAFGDWLRRFAEAELSKEGGSQPDSRSGS
uniref:CRISPR type III-B/RAMP module-associated protein Cmr5 n=1 Tax=Thermogemmatispora argillosa TaxID=2045280 RepID=A0A455SWD0_9CHLR|nr:type III-B CRISPR module-associated protein Cmr5 [Thermogemmatispora argillosa]